MNMDNKINLPKRKLLRLNGFNYNTPGAYFITICTHNRKCMFSNIVGAIHESPAIQLTKYGQILNKVINNLPKHYDVIIDRYVIMPNHIHMIIIIEDYDKSRAIHESPLQNKSIISKTVGYIKMQTAKEIHIDSKNIIVWQRGFHDHIIRNQKDYEKISKYIYENPLLWQDDCFFQNTQ
jgi:REP element-mobilizing transposase RayT